MFIGYKQQAFLLTLVYKIGKEALICTKMLTLCLVYAIGYRLLATGFLDFHRQPTADSQKPTLLIHHFINMSYSKLILSAALTGAATSRLNCPYIPYTPVEIAEEAKRAVDAGASIVHIHAREDDGIPS